MTMNRTPRPRDPLQLGKLMVDIATGQVPDAVDDGKDVNASALAAPPFKSAPMKLAPSLLLSGSAQLATNPSSMLLMRQGRLG